MVDTRRKPFGELSKIKKLTAVIIPTLAALWSIFGGIYSFSQAMLAYNTLSSTAADVISTTANFDSRPVVDVILSETDCATLAAKSSLEWEGLVAKDRFVKSGSTITGSNEKDTSFTGTWKGASAYCMCGTTDFPSTSGAKEHLCNATTYDVSKDDPSLGCLPKGTTGNAGGNTGGNNSNTRGGTVRTNNGAIYSHHGLCNATSIARGCVSIPEVKHIDLKKLPSVWNAFGSEVPPARTGRYFCARRAGKPWKDYPITSEASDCDPTTHVFCGTFCFAKEDNGGKCPLQDFVTVNAGYIRKTYMGNGSVTTTEYPPKTPLVNIVLGRGLPCYGYEGGDGNGYDKQVFTAIPNLIEPDNGWTDTGQCSYENTGTTEESKATGVDTRYSEVMVYDQWSLYSANGIDSNGVSDKVGVSGTEANRTVYNPNKFITSDQVAADSSSGSRWTLASRGGIYWKPECEADRNKQRRVVTENKDPVTQLVNLHYWLMFTQGFFGLFIVGIVLGTTTLYSMHSPNQNCPCVRGEGVEEMKRIGKFKTICGTSANLIKLPVLFVCVSLTGTAGRIFSRFSGCAGDDISNRSFKSMSDMILAAGDADLRALYIDVTMLLYTLVTSFMAWRKGCKPNYAIMREPPEGWDDDQKKDIQLP